MRGIISDPSQRKKRELHSGPPCPHYPHKFRTEAAHKAKVASRLRCHRRFHKSSLDYRLKAILVTIRHRCASPKHRSYKYYGGKGVRNFLTFDMLKFIWKRDGADKMRRPSIDRIDNSGDYEFSNVRFIPLAENIGRANRNRPRVQVRQADPQPRQERA